MPWPESQISAQSINFDDTEFHKHQNMHWNIPVHQMQLAL